MAKALFDQEALMAQFESATAKGSAQLRQATEQATLQALKSREMTLKNVRAALQAVGEAATQGAMQNLRAGVDPQALMDRAVAGMDDALVKAVEAHRAALSQFAAQGADLRDQHLKKAVGELERFEDAMFDTLKKVADKAESLAQGAMSSGKDNPAMKAVADAWAPVLSKWQAQGSASGLKAAATAQEMIEQMQAGVRSSRAASLKAAQVMAEGYATLVSGVLLGLSQAMGAAAVVQEKPKKSGKVK